MNAPLSRRSLLGASTAALGAASIAEIGIPSRMFSAVAGLAAADIGMPMAGLADARLLAIAAELNAIDAACNAHTSLHRGRETDATEAEFEALVDRFSPLEAEMAELPADTLAGVLAKVRVLDIPTCAACESGIPDSVCADIRRLHAAGVLI